MIDPHAPTAAPSQRAERPYERPSIADYVGRTNQQVLTPSYQLDAVEIHGFFLEADQARLQRQCDLLLNEPLGGGRRYQVVGPWALLRFAEIGGVHPFWSSGKEGACYYPDRHAGLWIPITCDDWDEGTIGFFPWCEFVASGTVRASLRETYGGPFEHAEIALPGDGAAPSEGRGAALLGRDALAIRCEVRHLNEGHLLQQAAELLRLVPLRGGGGGVTEEALAPTDVPAGIPATARGVAEALVKAASQEHFKLKLVLLKQYRDAEHAGRAAWQSVVEIDHLIGSPRLAWLPDRYRMLLRDVTSHPLRGALGLDPGDYWSGVHGFRLQSQFAIYGLGSELAPKPAAREATHRARRSAAELPRYIDIEGLTLWHQPFEFPSASFTGFVLDARLPDLQRIIDAHLNAPARGQVHYRALAPAVILYFASIPAAMPASVRAGAPGAPRDLAKDDHAGLECMTREREAGIWIPLLRTRGSGPGAEAEKFTVYPYYTFLDSYVGMSNGREIYGMYKELADVVVPDDARRGEFALRPVVVPRLSEPSVAEEQTLVEIGPIRGTHGGALRQIAGAASLTAQGLKRLFDETRVGPRFAWQTATSLVKGQPTFVFLKQYRHAGRSDGACYQALVEADFKIRALRRVELLSERYRLAINHFESHPLVRELGLSTAYSEDLHGFSLEMDFAFANGRTVCET